MIRYSVFGTLPSGRGSVTASRTLVVACLAALPCFAGSVTSIPVVESGYRQMYNLQFDDAHKTFAAFERDHPKDPMGTVSNAAAYLFAEFDRLNILHSEFFVEDSLFRHRPKVTADPAVRKAFDEEISKSLQLSDAILASSPRDTDAMFVKIMALGLRADFVALIDRHYLDSLNVLKSSRATAEQLLAIEPAYYDAYLAVGVENYMLSLKAAPIRWFLQLNGAETDRDRGIQNLRLTAEKGNYLSPYARLLLAVAALRNKDKPQAREILSKLVTEFPHNRLYSEELARLQ
jgi:hypothetical protein